jgi:hypothetical protein
VVALQGTLEGDQCLPFNQTLAVIQGTLAVIQGTLAMIQGTLVVIQGTLAVIQGTLAVIYSLNIPHGADLRPSLHP